MKQLKNTKTALSHRQESLLSLLQKGMPMSNKDLVQELRSLFGDISRVTLIRDLNTLLDLNLIQKKGKGRNITYRISPLYSSLTRPFDAAKYFSIEPDKRIILDFRADFSSQSKWNALLDEKETRHLDRITNLFKKRLKIYSSNQIKRELERITIEFSWKSSQIEGNTYSLLDTERLIKNNTETKGKTHMEAVMILNHKKAMEYVWNHAASFKKISIHTLQEFHALLVQDLDVARGLRKRPVGIIGTAYRPYDNVHQIKESLDLLIALINQIKNPFLKAIAATVGIAYIQPFEDGNKRTSRVLANAILVAHGCCPLSYRSVDEVEYKQAVILFDEQHSAAFFKKLFMDQYDFAVKKYFL